MRLQEKIIAITGASRGLGLALSRAFAAEDAQVTMLARTPAELSAVSQELDGAIAITCDVSKPEDVRMDFGQIASHFGGLNILVDNAAQGYPQAIEEAHDDLLKLQVEVNLFGPLYCNSEAIPMTRTCGAADIVNISSEWV
jgi:NAD(P)-dependent dehydrogenase (short-subunit alcohol dehydrogenase family)